MRPGALALAAAVGTIALAGSHTTMIGQTNAPADDARWVRAAAAWDLGHYPDALAELRDLMASSAAEAYLERTALLTGELYPTIEVTPDGRLPRLSGDGTVVTYEVGPTAAPLTRIVRVTEDGVATIAEVPGISATPNPTGTAVVYVRPGANPNLPGSIVVLDLATRRERVVETSGLLVATPAFALGARVIFVAAHPEAVDRSQVYLEGSGGEPPLALTNDATHKTDLLTDSAGTTAVYGTTTGITFGPRGPSTPAAGALIPRTVIDLRTRRSRQLPARALALSHDGQRAAWVERTEDGPFVLRVGPAMGPDSRVIRSGAEPIDALTFSPDGGRLAYQVLLGDTWDIFATERDGTERRVTRDVQQDVLPRLLSDDTILAMRGEPRHRRSYLHDLRTGAATRISANNTLRTLSFEYAWSTNRAGTRLLVQAERDGDTVSPERGVYLVPLDRRVSVGDVRSRIARQMAAEADLRARLTRAFDPIRSQVATATSRIAADRVQAHLAALVGFGSKNITAPGNAQAISYLDSAYRSFGYDTDLQWFQPANPAAHRTANVVAMKRGALHPDVIYVVSSHFDSVVAGPGADDNSSGTAALLELARALADVPLPATVLFASLTSEESGLLGSREFVRRAAQAGQTIAGVINNDTIGWRGDGTRIDNSIRYTNVGIRDVQHGAALLFSRLVTFDTRYYRGTDAQAFFDSWGDIIGGFGSHPILANPHYHRASDLLPTVDVEQVTETAKATAATVMLLASSPAPVKGLAVTRHATFVRATWEPSRERDVESYVVTFASPRAASDTRVMTTTTFVELPNLDAGTPIAVRAVNRTSLHGWDWTRSLAP